MENESASEEDIGKEFMKVMKARRGIAELLIHISTGYTTACQLTLSNFNNIIVL